jgi:non-heme Fe2+,alpha-ketoglutarate-dependent halogenase
MNTLAKYELDDQKLRSMGRDLRFYPVGVRNPQNLRPQHIRSFNSEGYIKGIRVFDDAEIAQIRRYFDELLERVLAEGESSYSIISAHLKYGCAYDLLKHPRIVALVKDLLGENVIGWGSHYFCKLPHDGKTVPWHQDASYWPLTPSKTLTVWLAIDDANVENSCMRFIPGSHHLGHLTYEMTEDREHNLLPQAVVDAEQFGEPVSVELDAGQVSIHSDLLLHSSEANDSDRRRCGLALRYCAVEVRAHLGFNERGIIVAGQDLTNHWANPPRPIETTFG